MTATAGTAPPIDPPRPGAAGARPPTGDVRTGILLMIAFSITAPGIDVFAKLATDSLPSAQITGARFAVQGLVLLPLVLWRASWRRLTRTRAVLHGLRGLLMVIATVCFITALRAMPIADAIAIFFVEPMILTLLGGLLLREQVGWRRYAACAVGFLGALLVVRPSFDALGWIALLPLGTALAFAFYLVLTRHLAPDEDPFAMQCYTGLAGMLCIAAVLAVASGSGSPVFDPVWPRTDGWLLLAGVGVMATIAHLFLVFAFRNAPASVLAPLQYLEIVAATAFGFLIWGDFPDAVKWAGIAIVVGSGLFIFWRERVRSAAGRPDGPEPTG